MDSRVKAIMENAGLTARSEEDRALIADAELLASITDGVIKFDEIDEDALAHLIAAYGAEHVAEAFIEGGGAIEHRKEFRPTTNLPVHGAVARLRDFWSRASLLTMAASIAVIATLAVTLFMLTRKTPATLNESALNWTAADSTNVAGQKSWGRAQPLLAVGSPDFTPQGGVLGDPGDALFNKMRERTAIILTEKGFGSGAVVDPRGYILTCYHIVAVAAQQSALKGTLTTVEVTLPRLADGRIPPYPAVRATLYRADPEQDLALLKIESDPGNSPKPAPFFELANGADDSMCYMVGSPSVGPAWSVRSGTITRHLSLPDSAVQSSLGFPTAERMSDNLLYSDVPHVSAGDTGGPLLNDRGQLIGITLAPATEKAVAVAGGYHIALQNLKSFLAPLPNQPEGIPLDPWTAGLPDATMLEPTTSSVDAKGAADILRYRYLKQGPLDGAPRVVATVVYLNAGTPNSSTASSDHAAQIPAGLWGMAQRGRFRFDLLIMHRADGTTAVGYTNKQQELSELRIGSGNDKTARIIWRKTASSQWKSTTPAGKPMLDSSMVGSETIARLNALFQQAFDLN